MLRPMEREETESARPRVAALFPFRISFLERYRGSKGPQDVADRLSRGGENTLPKEVETPAYGFRRFLVAKFS